MSLIEGLIVRPNASPIAAHILLDIEVVDNSCVKDLNALKSNNKKFLRNKFLIKDKTLEKKPKKI